MQKCLVTMEKNSAVAFAATDCQARQPGTDPICRLWKRYIENNSSPLALVSIKKGGWRWGEYGEVKVGGIDDDALEYNRWHDVIVASSMIPLLI